MGLNLRKIRDAAFAQINPFDGGKTASTVWNNTPVGYKDQAQTIRPTGLASRNGTIYIDQQARQVSQARPQQSFIPGNQQKPSGFMGALNDAFDANTANDIAKRNQAELAKAQMAKENGRVYAPKLNQTYTQQQTALGNRSYTNPIQSIAYGLAKDPAKGINSLAGAYAKGLEGTAGLTAIAASKLVNTSDEFQNNLQQEVGNRMNAPIAFSNKGGLLGQGTNFKTAQELDNKKKFASSMVKTGVDVGSVIPVGGGAAQGTGIIAKQGAKQLIGNSLLNAGLSGTQSIATQVNENRPIDLKEAGLSTLAGGALPVVAFGAGRLLKGASNEVGKKLKMNQTGAIPLDPKNNPLGKGAPIEKTPQVGKIDPMASLKQEAKGFKTADEFVDYAMSKRSYDPANAKIGDNIRIDTVGQNGTTTVQGKIVDINTSVNMVDGAVTDPGLHKNTFIKIEQPDGSIVEMPAQKIPGKRMYSNADYAYSPKELADIHAQSTTPQATSGAPIEKTPKTPQQIKQSLNEGFLDIDTSNREAVKSVFDNAGYVDNGGFKVHPNVDQRWVDDLSPETKQLMADEGITYIDPSPDQDVWAMAVQKNLGNNKVKGISVNSKKDAGLFTNKDSIVAHEIGHHKWNQLTPAEKAEWANRPAQSEFGKRIEAGHQHSGAMKGEEEFAEQYARSKTGTYGSGDKPLRVQGAPIEKTPLEALKAEARKYKSAEEFANSLNAMKYGKVTGVGQLPVSKINKTQIKALTERGLPHTDTNLKVSDFKPGRQVTQPLEVYSKGGSWVVENGNHRLAQALANGDETVPVVFKGGEGKKYSTPIADLYNQAHTQPTPKVEAPKLNTPSIRPAYRETKLKKAEYRELGITDANLKQAEIMANDYIGRVDKAKSKAEVERIANKGYAELSDYPGGPSFQKSLADAEVYRKQHLIDTGVESSGIEPTRPHEKPTETSAEQAARGQAEFERRVKMAGLTLDENGNIATQAPQPTVAPKGAPIEKTPQPKSAPIEKTYVVPKTNSTDVTKLADKDLQYFAKQGYTSITDRYGNTRNITPVKTDGIERLDSLNPTGGIYVDYNPKARATMPLADNINTLDKTARKAPDELVTIYRGAPSNQKSINPGDFITTNKELAKSYTGDGNVLEMKVPASHILDDVNSPLGEEYLYRPTKSGAPIEKTPTRAQAMNKVAVAASEAPKLKTPNDLLPNGVDETLAKIDAQNKLMFAKSEATGATPKPKVKSAPKPVVKAAPSTKPNVVKSVKPEKPVVVAKGANVAPVDVDAQLEKEIFGVMAEPNYKQSTLGTLGEKLSPNRQIRKVTQAIEGGINKGVRGSLESGSRIVRTPGRTVAGVSRQAGRTNEELAQYGKLQGGKQMGDELGLKIAQTGDEAIQQGVNPAKVADALDPALTSARGGKAPVLTELEQSEVNRLRRIIDLTHEGEHNLGLLNDKVYEANKGTYFPRNFDDFFENDVTRQIAKDNKLDLNIFKNRKDLADIPAEVLEKANRDPYYMTALRTQQYAKNKAVVEHTRWLKDSGSVIDTPKKGYIQVPDSPAYGAIKGKYVLKEQLEDLQGFIYETDTAQHVVALLNTFDRNPARQFLKKTKTVYNPGVRLGNRTFNYLTAGINGINPITYTKNWARANGMMKNKSPEFLEATKEGVFGSSIIDKELYQVGDALTPVKGNAVTKVVKGADNAVTNTYRGVDDKAKMATYLTFRERGVGAAEAAKRTRRAMQNYDMVGQFFDLGAKTPIGGSAFVRFSSELLRMAHNSAVDNPLRLAGAMASVVALTTMASKMSGESAEDRKTREGRLGAPKVPFTNQSLEVQTPYGAINIGRLLGVTTYNDINGGVAEDGKRLLPFQLPITNTKNGVKFNPSFVTSDPLIGPIMGQIIDKDFRGKSIKDPENTGQFLDQLSTKDQLINRAKVAGMSYIPLANEANSLVSAVQGKENFYGKKRSPVQAGLRVAGVKVEQYGPEQAKKQRSINEYFKEKDALDKEVATLPKKDQEAYKQATGYYKLREQVPNEFSPGDTRYKKAPVYDFSENKWGEYASSPKLYDLIMKDKERKAQKGQPLQPEFDKTLSSEFRKQLISNKALAPGENVEADQRLYSSSEWDTYSKLKDKYTADAKKYYPDKGDDTFVDEMVKHQNAPFPKKGSAKQAYDDAYALYAKGQGPKPTYTDQVDADKEAYSAAKLKWTNTERKARGLAPISKETWDNVTFGFESDEEKVYKELKYGRGYGGYSKYASRGGGGSSKTGLNSDAANPYKYAVSIKAKGSSKATVKLGGKIAKRGVTAKATSKPKVTIKKSTA